MLVFGLAQLHGATRRSRQQYKVATITKNLTPLILLVLRGGVDIGTVLEVCMGVFSG